MKHTNLIELALYIANDAHRGQVDLDGKPVILHPLAVGLSGCNMVEIVVGFLHDVVEDSNYTYADLEEIGVPSEIIEILRLLTHLPEESYEDYLKRIVKSGNATAIKVKWNDLTHNLSRGIKGKHVKQVEKHTKAKEFLKPYYEKVIME